MSPSPLPPCERGRDNREFQNLCFRAIVDSHNTALPGLSSASAEKAPAYPKQLVEACCHRSLVTPAQNCGRALGTSGSNVPFDSPIEDVLQGKVWAAADPDRRPSKRLKDLADIARMLEVAPRLRPLVPAEILAKLL